MKPMHVVDLTTLPMSVTTLGSEGQQLGVTTWPDAESALAYAERIASLFGGQIVEAVA